MVYIRKLLLFIRKTYEKLTLKQNIYIFSLWVVLVSAGILIDIFVPFNYFTNILRTIISLLNGTYIFSFGYIFTLYREKELAKKNRDEQEVVRDRFSYNQRQNISVVLWGVFIVLALLGANQNNFFTLFSSFLVAFALSILSFMRSTRSETQNASIGFKDPRDVLFEQRVKEELELRAKFEAKNKEGED